jgi:hypothetical protein
MIGIPIIPFPGQIPRHNLIDQLTDERDVARIELYRMKRAILEEQCATRMRQIREAEEMGVIAGYWDEEGDYY